jgi:RNA polymerase sigma-70 factor (ECF subfamily)
VGPWLPEPIVTADDPAEEVVMADSVRMALLVVLETLSPAERAVFVLHDVFGHSYAEVAEITGRTEAACRQLGHRARNHVEARRPRYGADPSQRALVAERFLDACATGDLDGLMAVLAPDAVVTSDGGGAVRAALRPVRGAGNAARLLLGILRSMPEGAQVAAVQLNGEPGFVVTVDGRSSAAVLLEIAGRSVMAVRIVVNPAKLAGVAPDGRLRPR